MNDLVFGAVADDDTGASDLAGMLAEQGLRTLLVIDLPSVEEFLTWSDGYDAVVMAEGTRNLTSAQARERTQAAIKMLDLRRPRTLQIKYCSTFDSTPEGNIGASIDAAMNELKADFTIALPALPVNGRTTYQGYHFVYHQLLSDSPMRHHPLTPMTNPDLVYLLSCQTTRRVGLAAYAAVEAGVDKLKNCFQDLRQQGVAIALVDCLNDKHLETICRAASDLRLITGSSAFGIKLPAIWREHQTWTPAPAPAPAPSAHQPERAAAAAAATSTANNTKVKGGCLLVAGSCSTATREQNLWLQAQGTTVVNISPIKLLSGDADTAQLSNRVRLELNKGNDCLLTTTAATTTTGDEVRTVQQWGASRGQTISALGQSIAFALADMVLEILEDTQPAGLIIAGGETSGALCRRLELGALRVGRNIESGVPLCCSLGRFQLPVVLKSGNFGGKDFYAKALRAVAQPAAYIT